MFFIHWLSRTSRRSHTPRQPSRDRTKERRLKLLRLEQRRVLNADFTFVAHGLNLDHVDGDLTVREVSHGTGHQIEFDLAGGSIWQDQGSTGLFAIDNSTPGHSILSVAKSDLESLTSGVSLHAASSDFDLQFDVQSSALDLSQMHGTLAAEGFGEIHQTAANDHQVRLGDVSLSADQITLSQFHADDITLNANEIDLTGGANSFSGSALSVHSLATPSIELGGTSDTVHELNFTDSDITALDASFHRISFEATSADAISSIHVDSPGADFHHAITPGHDGSLHLTADSVQIDGALSISGGLIDVTATQAATISATGSLISHGGDVHVDAGESGTLLDSGRVDVSNHEPGGFGGTVHLLGEQVGLFGGAEIDASGHSGGGKVLIGGDLHGDNDAIPHAAQTFVGHDVEIHADALQHGDGGQVVVWSDDVTQVYGSLTARGGALLGDGGLIETSSHNQLIVTRGGDASAAHGHAGTWLLDPLNVKIVLAPSDVYLVTEFAPLPFFTPTVVGSEVTADAIVDQLKTGTTVVISTVNPDETEDGDVIQEAFIDVPFANAGDSATFVISAANHIFINGGFNATNGSLNILLEANAGNDDLNPASGNVNINANINTNGGSFTSTGVDFDSAGQKVPPDVLFANIAATITATGGVSITHTGTVDLGVISTGLGFGGTTFISDANVRGAIQVGEGNVQIDGGNDGLPDSDNDDLHVMANITATDTVFLLADRDVIVESTITAGVNPLLPMAPLDPSANLSITSDANSDGDGGFWLKEIDNSADARLNAGGNITIVGAKLIDAEGNPNDGKISLRIDADPVASDPRQIVAGQDLTIVANFGNVSTAGQIVIDGIMEATGGALTVFFTDTAFLGADQTAGTDLLFQNAVQLTNDVTITAGNDATFASTVDDDGDNGTGSELTVTGPANTPVGGDVLFVGAIGATNGPEALSITGDGLVDFLSTVTVNGNLSVVATSESGRITFQAAVTTTNGGSVTITNDGLLVIGSEADFQVAGSFTQQSSLLPPNGTGSTELGANISTTNGSVAFAQAVLLTDAVTVNSNDHDITFSGTIDSEVSGANEEQTISLGMPTAGTFDISWDPPDLPGATVGEATVSGISFDESAEQIRMAFVAAVDLVFKAADPSLEITANDINVTGDPGGPFTFTFQGAFRGTNVAPITVDGASLVGGSASVLTTVPGLPIIAEHNPLTLIAGTGQVQFGGDIGAGFVDVGLGVDGDQTPGNLTITSADKVTFTNVALVATNGTIDIGAGTNVITSGIEISGPQSSISFQSRQNQMIDQNIRINGQVSSAVDLSLLATGDVTLTDDGSLFTSDTHSVTIVADSNGDRAGDLRMGVLSQIDASAGFIDVRAAEVFLGKLITTSPNPTDADNPAIRVIATFRSINDINGDADITGANLVAETRTNSTTPGAGVVLEAVLGIGSTDDPLETEIASLSAFNHDLSEQQMVTLKNATGGTFTLTWTAPGATMSAETTAAIPFNASASQVKLAFLQTFDTLTDADLDVSGNAGGPYIFTFQGSLRATDVADITASNANLIGSDPTTTPTPRVATVEATTISDPRPAENNIVVRDVGTNNGNRVDLIFVHNEANQRAAQFAQATEDFGTSTVLQFSAATPGPANNDIVIHFTTSDHTMPSGKDPFGPTIGVPVITVVGHEITIDLDANDADSNGTNANAVRDAINNNHQANVLIRASITTGSGFTDISGTADGTDVALSGASEDEDGVIDINIVNGDLRVVADNSRLVLSEMQKGIDTFNPPDLAVAAVQSENTIRLTAGTIEVFDDILAIQAMTQTTSDLDTDTTTFTVIDPSVFTKFDGTPFATPFFIKLTSEVLIGQETVTQSEIMQVTSIDGHDVTVVRGLNGTTSIAHRPGTIIETVNRDNGIREFIEIQARANFVLGADRVISTDDHYINSLNLKEDLNGNGLLDAFEPYTDANSNGVYDPGEAFIDANGSGAFDTGEAFYDANHNGSFDGGELFTDVNGNGRRDEVEDFNTDNMLQFNPGEDTNRNGRLDPTEMDTNGNGRLDLRGDKPATTATDDFFSQPEHDYIHIVADSDKTGGNEGRVLLGENSAISTDNGIEQEISPRPVKFGSDPQKFTYAQNTAFFSGEIIASNLTSRFLFNGPETLADGTVLPQGSIVYLGTLTFTIGVPGEKNLIVDIDWGDHDRTAISPVPPVLANTIAPRFENGIYVFDATKDQHATRFLIPEGGAKYSIPHDFPDNAVNLKDLNGAPIQTPGRLVTSDRLQVRFAVSQHSSIVVDGNSALDSSVQPEDVTKAPPDVLLDTPMNAPPVDTNGRAVNFPYAADNPTLTQADPLFQLSSTNVLDQTDVFLPRFDNGIVSFSIPTAPSVPRPPEDVPIPPPALPKPFIPEAGIINTPQITTETSRSSSASSSVTTDEYFELRRTNEDGSITSERLNELAGESLLNRERFEDFVRDLGDGEYEIFFITRDNKDGTTIPRSVIQFRLESGRLAPPANDSPNLFKPFRLIPVLKAPPVPPAPPNQPKGNGAAADKNPDAQDDGKQDTSDEELSALPFHERQSDPNSWLGQETGHNETGHNETGHNETGRNETGHNDSDSSFAVSDTALAAGDSIVESDASEAADLSPMAAGLLLVAGTRWRKNRFNPFGSSLFSKTARLARKRVAIADDQ